MKRESTTIKEAQPFDVNRLHSVERDRKRRMKWNGEKRNWISCRKMKETDFRVLHSIDLGSELRVFSPPMSVVVSRIRARAQSLWLYCSRRSWSCFSATTIAERNLSCANASNNVLRRYSLCGSSLARSAPHFKCCVAVFSPRSDLHFAQFRTFE